MAGFTVVGATTATVAFSSSGHTISIPLPAGTSIGDTLILGHRVSGGAGQFAVSDPRMSVVTSIVGPAVRLGGFGIASDLSDVDVAVFAFAYGALVLVAVTDVVGIPQVSCYLQDPTSSTLVFDEIDDAGAAVAVVADRAIGAAIGDSGDWDTEDSASESYSGETATVKAFSFLGGPPVPALDVSMAVGTGERGGLLVAFHDPAPSTARRYLRQRQSPRANPRVGIARTLRQRQKFL